MLTKEEWRHYILETSDIDEYIDRHLIAGESLTHGEHISIGREWCKKYYRAHEDVLNARAKNDYYLAVNRINNRKLSIENDYSTDFKRRWIIDDCQIFVGMKIQGKDISEIAQELDRSYDATKAKSEQYGWIIEAYKLDCKEKLINNITFVAEELLKPYYSAREEYKGW